jgi:hypothetical protein
MVMNSVNKILVGNPPKKTYNGQNFDFDFDVKQGLISFLFPTWSCLMAQRLQEIISEKLMI